MSGFGKILVLFGAILILLGTLLTFVNKVPWIGRLPGDVYIKKGNLLFYFPLATSILLSIVISLILIFIGRRQ
ncbi:MAG: DUF2905 domain-containing protein [Candidatus Omnitrophica bacterium]|nr:DUF2905 domain-containing protein [Candidatus Omnitrophota bacterium]